MVPGELAYRAGYRSVTWWLRRREKRRSCQQKGTSPLSFQDHSDRDTGSSESYTASYQLYSSDMHHPQLQIYTLPTRYDMPNSLRSQSCQDHSIPIIAPVRPCLLIKGLTTTSRDLEKRVYKLGRMRGKGSKLLLAEIRCNSLVVYTTAASYRCE